MTATDALRTKNEDNLRLTFLDVFVSFNLLMNNITDEFMEFQMERLTLSRLPDKKGRARIGNAAERIYEPMRERLEREHWGEYISINVENGDYAVAPEHLAAVSAIKVKYPGIVPVTIRIGYKAVVHFGGTGITDGRRP